MDRGEFKGEDVVDMRLFINNHPSRKGFYFLATEWNNFFEKLMDFKDIIENRKEVKNLNSNHKDSFGQVHFEPVIPDRLRESI